MSKPIIDPRAEALQYMDKHKIKILFDILGCRLARDKPENPNEFLVNELQKIQQQKSANLTVRTRRPLIAGKIKMLKQFAIGHCVY